MKKISTVQAYGKQNFEGAKANDRCRSGRSLVVLLCFGGSRQNHSGTESADDTGSDEADILEDTATVALRWRPEHIRHG